MAIYILRDIPDDVWQTSKVKAATEGTTMKDVLLQLVTAYSRQPTVRGTPATRQYPDSHSAKLRAAWTPERRVKHGKLIKKIAKRKRRAAEGEQ